MIEWDQYSSYYDQPVFEGKPRPYLIASTPRSGSHYLGHLLFETGDLGSPLEYFHPSLHADFMKKIGVPDGKQMLLHLFRTRTSQTGWFGIKAHWPQFHSFMKDSCARKLLDFEVYIRILRGDTLAQAISLVIARQTNAWISFHTSKHIPEYDFISIKRAVSEIERENMNWDRYFLKTGIDPIIVKYESLVSDPLAAVENIRDAFQLTTPPKNTACLLKPAKQRSSANLDWQERYNNDLRATRQP
jgi:trehalose 2-sulfotransferase